MLKSEICGDASSSSGLAVAGASASALADEEDRYTDAADEVVNSVAADGVVNSDAAVTTAKPASDYFAQLVEAGLELRPKKETK